jgi:hypothetical protein
MFRVLTWPLRMLWSLIGVIFLAAGKLLTLLIGLLLVVAGVLLACTLVGAFAGVPMILFGLLLIIRSLF